MSWNSNMSGVTTVARATPKARRSSSVSTFVSKRASAVSYRRCESAASRPRVLMMRTAVSYVPRSVVMIGTLDPSPSSSRMTGSGSSKPPFSTIPEIDGKVPEAFASRVASSTSDRSAGMTTTAPLEQARQHVDHRHARDDDPEGLAGEPVGVTRQQLAVD